MPDVEVNHRMLMTEFKDIYSNGIPTPFNLCRYSQRKNYRTSKSLSSSCLATAGLEIKVSFAASNILKEKRLSTFFPIVKYFGVLLNPSNDQPAEMLHYQYKMPPIVVTQDPHIN